MFWEAWEGERVEKFSWYLTLGAIIVESDIHGQQIDWLTRNWAQDFVVEDVDCVVSRGKNYTALEIRATLLKVASVKIVNAGEKVIDDGVGAGGNDSDIWWYGNFVVVQGRHSIPKVQEPLCKMPGVLIGLIEESHVYLQA